MALRLRRGAWWSGSSTLDSHPSFSRACVSLLVSSAASLASPSAFSDSLWLRFNACPLSASFRRAFVSFSSSLSRVYVSVGLSVSSSQLLSAPALFKHPQLLHDWLSNKPFSPELWWQNSDGCLIASQKSICFPLKKKKMGLAQTQLLEGTLTGTGPADDIAFSQTPLSALSCLTLVQQSPGRGRKSGKGPDQHAKKGAESQENSCSHCLAFSQGSFMMLSAP